MILTTKNKLKPHQKSKLTDEIKNKIKENLKNSGIDKDTYDLLEKEINDLDEIDGDEVKIHAKKDDGTPIELNVNISNITRNIKAVKMDDDDGYEIIETSDTNEPPVMAVDSGDTERKPLTQDMKNQIKASILSSNLDDATLKLLSDEIDKLEDYSGDVIELKAKKQDGTPISLTINISTITKRVMKGSSNVATFLGDGTSSIGDDYIRKAIQNLDLNPINVVDFLDLYDNDRASTYGRNKLLKNKKVLPVDALTLLINLSDEVDDEGKKPELLQIVVDILDFVNPDENGKQLKYVLNFDFTLRFAWNVTHLRYFLIMYFYLDILVCHKMIYTCTLYPIQWELAKMKGAALNFRQFYIRNNSLSLSIHVLNN